MKKYAMFNAFGEGYLSLENIFVLKFLSTLFIYFLHETCMEKVLQELTWEYFFGHPYHSNGTKKYLDTALILFNNINFI